MAFGRMIGRALLWFPARAVYRVFGRLERVWGLGEVFIDLVPINPRCPLLDRREHTSVDGSSWEFWAGELRVVYSPRAVKVREALPLAH